MPFPLPTRFTYSAIVSKADGSEQEEFTWSVDSEQWEGDPTGDVLEIAGNGYWTYESYDADPDVQLCLISVDPFRDAGAIQAWTDAGYVIQSFVLWTDCVGESVRALRLDADILDYIPASSIHADRLPENHSIPNILVLGAGGSLDIRTSKGGKHGISTVQFSVRTDNSLDADAIRELVTIVIDALAPTFDANSGTFVTIREGGRGELPEEGNVYHYFVRYECRTHKT